MKYFILILAAVLGILSIRVQSNNLSKAMYVEGCNDSALKLKLSGKIEESEQITRFCAARKEALDQFMNAF